MNAAFRQLMGLEIPAEYGGTNTTFFSSILVIEELAKYDGAVSVMCDIQNTLLNTLLINYGSEHLKNTYLPQMATNLVSNHVTSQHVSTTILAY